MKLFDRFEKLIFTGAVARLFSTPAVWTSSADGIEYPEKVFFNNPTRAQTLDKTEFADVVTFIEFLTGTFPTLRYLVDGGSTSEFITINGDEYNVTSVEKLHDGNTFKAILLLVGGDYNPKS